MSYKYPLHYNMTDNGLEIAVDEELDSKSSNPVANWVVKKAIDSGGGGGGGGTVSVKVGNTTTLEPGKNATVTNSGDDQDVVLNFGIPRGNKGDKGDNGETGPQGVQGLQGVKGDQGEKGEQGIQGPQGEQGVKGDQGEKGEKGDKGDKGDAGKDFSISKTYPSIADMEADKDNVEEGSFVMIVSGEEDPDNAKLYVKGATDFDFVVDLSGAKGIKGDKGDKGDDGAKGEKGDTGETGPQGPQGEQGVQGPQGEKGNTGPQGVQGIQGVQGDKGEKGDTGEQGAGVPKDGVIGFDGDVIPDGYVEVAQGAVVKDNEGFVTGGQVYSHVNSRLLSNAIALGICSFTNKVVTNDAERTITSNGLGIYTIRTINGGTGSAIVKYGEDVHVVRGFWSASYNGLQNGSDLGVWGAKTSTVVYSRQIGYAVNGTWGSNREQNVTVASGETYATVFGANASKTGAYCEYTAIRRAGTNLFDIFGRYGANGSLTCVTFEVCCEAKDAATVPCIYQRGATASNVSSVYNRLEILE